MRPLRVVLSLAVMIPATTVHAGPVEIDLTPERMEFEAKDRPRKVGLTLLAGTLVFGAASAYGWSQASNANSQLRAQQVPVNLAQRQDLVGQGERGNVIGLVTALLGIGTGIASAYFLTVSF